MFVPADCALDQFLAREVRLTVAVFPAPYTHTHTHSLTDTQPHKLFDGSLAAVCADVANPNIARLHTLCSLYELLAACTHSHTHTQMHTRPPARLPGRLHGMGVKVRASSDVGSRPRCCMAAGCQTGSMFP